MAINVNYVTKETVTNLKRNLSMASAALLTVAVSLTLVGGALLVKRGVERATILWRGNVELSIFMKPDASGPELEAVSRQLAAMPEVKSARYVDKAKAYDAQNKNKPGDGKGKGEGKGEAKEEMKKLLENNRQGGGRPFAGVEVDLVAGGVESAAQVGDVGLGPAAGGDHDRMADRQVHRVASPRARTTKPAGMIARRVGP